MAVKKFTYRGPNSSVTLKQADGAEQDVILWNGSIVELPEDHEYVVSLLAQGFLEPALVMKSATKKGGE